MTQEIPPNLHQWVCQVLGTGGVNMHSLAGDASFRRYYRVTQHDKSWIAMVSPPTEGYESFVALARAWHAAHLPVPQIYACFEEQGFALLSDFGDVLLEHALKGQNVDYFYEAAMKLLMPLQCAHPNFDLPVFDRNHMEKELGYFEEWFLEKLLQVNLGSMKPALKDFFTVLIDEIEAQPQVIIHRDYHSRNLMVIKDSPLELGLLDFQDAMQGPLVYDLVSLIKDCYLAWPRYKHEEWIKYYGGLLAQHNRHYQEAQLMQWVDWTGLQRHLKVLGIFARLKLRDNKPQYILYLEGIMNYILEVTARYTPFASLDQWLRADIFPRLKAL